MRIAVIGSGYVGLVSAACFAEIGEQVISVDNDVAKITAVQREEVPIQEHFLPELLKRHHGKRLQFSTSIIEAADAPPSAIFTAPSPPPLGRRARALSLRATATEAVLPSSCS